MPEERHQNSSEEKRLAELLRRVDQAALPPDAEFLAALREKTTELFVASAAPSNSQENNLSPLPVIASLENHSPAESATSSEISVSKQLPEVRPQTQPQPKPRNPMLTLAFRGIAALVTVVSLFSAWFVSLPERAAQGSVPFSKVLEQMRGADSLQFRVLKGGHAVDVWLRRPGLVRRQESPQQYEIAAGSRLWKIDETANTVTEADSRWFLGPDKQVDLLALLEVGVTDATPLMTALSRKRADYRGHECEVYETMVQTRDGSLRIVAYADARTQQLASITAWPANPQLAAAGPPLAELQLVAFNPPIEDEKFVVAKSLSEDGRIGKVSAAQGIVLLRPLLAKRWTPVSRGLPIKPGDWVRTDLRGANAVKVALTSEFEVVLGPGALLECLSPTQARLHAGEAQVHLVKTGKSTFELLAPRAGSRKFTAAGKALLRVGRDEQLIDVKQTPVWLAGFEGTSSNESLGSLIVNIDGRNEPLSVGYHKVNVEVRDQIARTTIEESFVNHTAGRLEGIFHFPLPQDASISGFGMWIGNDLVEADVVEKQRAREIFETILREKRDPGLLEWTGGNIFKARVFPIEAHSEKRIKIVYTQVLPLRANRYRYAYGLRSEMLQTRPLRELSLTVTVSSALGLKNITCPTHSARVQKTAHSGQIEFTAQEYTPDRDFEVVCEIDGRQSDVAVIPHRRGADGYFLMQLTPPGAEGNWQRELLPEGTPLKLVLLCDTSSSMDSEKRKQQREFVGTVLSSLGPNDRFQLAAADVGTVWPFAEPVAPTAENLANVRTFLDERISLGWTDLTRAFGDVLKKAPDDAQVIYVGDGIVTAHETDPHSFVKQLRRLVLGTDEKKSQQKRGFHAVTVGNSFEGAVVKGIAGLAGGSVRSIGGEQSPQVIALELLNELAQPGLRDIQVEFRGVKVAAVYPEKLPNVPAGMQQILVGRYLPEGKDQQGEVIVTGKRGSEPVRYAARINLKDAEEGNSFIPRLWSRGHLEQLLQQGQSEAIRDQVIALSEEFHIITPYTSLLVLESDTDRERFGVKRRYEMRDGEKFFAEGRGNSNFELLQQQMKRAGNWRVGMRRRVLRSLLGLGRNPGLFGQTIRHRQNQYVDYFGRQAGRAGTEDYRLYEQGQSAGFALAPAAPTSSAPSGAAFAPVVPLDSIAGEDENYAPVELLAAGDAKDAISESFSKLKMSDSRGEFDEQLELGIINEKQLRESPKEELAVATEEEGYSEREAGKKRKAGFRQDLRFDKEISLDDAGSFGIELSDADELRSFELGEGLEERDRKPSAGPVGFRRLQYYPGKHEDSAYQQDYTSWLNTLFPSLSPVPGKLPQQLPSNDPEHWSAEAIALSKSLVRGKLLEHLKGGIETRQIVRGYDPRWNRRTNEYTNLSLQAQTGWLTRPQNPDGQTFVNYCDGKERGVYSRAFLLGSGRSSVTQDLQEFHLSLNGTPAGSLHDSYRTYRARVEPTGENRVTLILSNDAESNYEVRLLIDTQRRVQLKQETLQQGKLTTTAIYEDFVQVGGLWWARKLIGRDAQGRITSENLVEVRELSAEQFAARMKDELAAKADVQFLPLEPVKLNVARQKGADGSADFADRITLLVHFAQLQQWDDVLKQIDAIEKLAPRKPGVRWLRTSSLQMMRRNEEARTRYLAELRQIAASKTQDELFLIEYILNHTNSLSSAPEQMESLQLAKPVFERQPAHVNGLFRWETRLADNYESTGRIEESLALRKKLAEQVPWEVYTQTEYARRLQNAGRIQESLAWLRNEIDRKVERNAYENDALFNAYADMLRAQGSWEALVKFTAEWVARNPETTNAYSQHFSALFFNDQVAAAYALADRWLKESRVEAKLRPDQLARLEASVSLAQGHAHHISYQWMDLRWFEPLADTARYFVNHKHHFEIARRIVDDYRFRESEISDRLRSEFLTRLLKEPEKLSPMQLSMFAGWTLSQSIRLELAEPINGRKQMLATELPIEIWDTIAKTIHARWVSTQDKHDKFLLGERLQIMYSVSFRDTKLLPFLRERLNGAPPEFKQGYLTRLFDELLTRPWTEEIETECFARLRELSTATEVTEQLMMQLPALHRLVDSLVTRRPVREEKQWRDKGGLDKLTRQEIAKKKREFAETARKAVAARLGQEASQQKNATLAAWMRMEQAWLDVRQNQRLPQVAEECWQIVGEVPEKAITPEAWAELSPPQQRQRGIDRLLRHRAWSTLMFLATRRDAAPQAITRVLKYIDAGLALPEKEAAPWRRTKFRMLIALDRPDDLERELQAWIRSDVPTAPWRILLGYLVAERGKIAEAISPFEAAEKEKLLTAGDLRQLADWYLVVNRRPDYERMRIAAFKLMPEYQLSNLLYQIQNRWTQSGLRLPSELDENTLFAFRAVFEKSANPENYLYQLRNIYLACRDFRLLQMIPDAVLGRSPQQAYTFLRSLYSNLLYELRNEATADEILARVRVLRTDKLTPTDLRALDLLEVVVERKSSEVLNQPGPHVEKCLAALKRAFDRKWGEGEPRMMATFLQQLERLPHPSLVEEQLRELRALQEMTKVGSRDHLQITFSRCTLLFNAYNRREEALREMEAEIAAYEGAHGGRWPFADVSVLDGYISFLENLRRFASGEAILLKHFATPERASQKQWLNQRLLRLYDSTLSNDGEVSLGSGVTLFEALLTRFHTDLEAAPDENVRYTLISQMSNTLRIAHSRLLPNATFEIEKFAFKTVPATLRRQQSLYHAVVTIPAHLLRETLAPQVALRYVVERMEQYPQRFEYTYENAWNAFGYQLGEFRQRAAQAGAAWQELAPRVLALTLKELRSELRAGERRGYTLCHRYQSYYWSEKIEDFIRTANEVYNEQPGSGRIAVRVAQYFWDGLDQTNRAIEIMVMSHGRGILDDANISILIGWLQQQNRYGETIALLEPLVRTYPDVINHRTRLMAAYSHTQRKQQLHDLVKQIEQHFHQGGRWTEANISALAYACQTCDLIEPSIKYFNEAISLHKRDFPYSNRGNAWLYETNRALAQAYAKVGDTVAAVAAASEAVVCSPAQQYYRTNAIVTLRDVLEKSKDLDAYVKHLDKESAVSGKDSPVLRKLLGKVYLEQKRSSALAIPQLELAISLQPQDRETQELLITAYDAAGRKEDATRQLLRQIDVQRSNLKLYEQLVVRLKDNEAEAERAATSLIEAAPKETENQTAFAELRQRQNRWDEAIPHWEQVAQLRRLEPTGLIKLAEAQIHEKRWDDAKRSVDQLSKTSWPSRFNDVQSQTHRLRQQLPK